MRVILDTNILLSGLLIAQGPQAQLLDAWRRNCFTLVVCPELIAEFHDVSSRPFFKARLRASAVEELTADLREFSAFVVNLAAAEFAPDPKDSYLLGLAETAQADYLITGDKALQGLKRHKSTQVATAVVLLAILRDAEQQ